MSKNTTQPVELDFNDVEGAQLLVPINKVKGSDQARLIARLTGLGVGLDETAGADDIDIDALADFVDYVGEHFAVNENDFVKFTSGAGGFTRAINLCLQYAAELGKEAS